MCTFRVMMTYLLAFTMNHWKAAQTFQYVFNHSANKRQQADFRLPLNGMQIQTKASTHPLKWSVVLSTLLAVLVGRIMEKGYQDCAFLCTIILTASLTLGCFFSARLYCTPLRQSTYDVLPTVTHVTPHVLAIRRAPPQMYFQISTNYTSGQFCLQNRISPKGD